MGNCLKRMKLYVRIAGKACLCLWERVTHPGAAYWILTPEHENLGDHAIAQAERLLFHEHGIKVIEITGAELQRRREMGLLRLMNGRKILVHGGGFLGTLWFTAELLLRAAIIQNPRSRIVVLPNTVYYEDNESGQKELQRSAEIYNAHKHLTLYMRERKSFEIASALYRDVRLMPDMVMYLDCSFPPLERSGCVLCLRGDRERTMDNAQRAQIVSQVTALFHDRVSYLDMVTDHPVYPTERDNALSRQYEAFKRAELVVTDRLHGMIFSAITGTPCIVLNSKSHKVRGCYSWLKHLAYIRLCDDPQALVHLYASIPKERFCYDNSALLPYYSELMNSIKKETE